MPQFNVVTAFAFRGSVRKAGLILEINKEDLEQEIDLGNHPDTGNPMSGLLNHCVPIDRETEELVRAGGITPQMDEKVSTPEEQELEKESILEEMEKLGAFCNPKWKLIRMQKELVKAKKERAENPISRDKAPAKSEKI